MHGAISAGSRRSPLSCICEEIAEHAESHPDWLERSGL